MSETREVWTWIAFRCPECDHQNQLDIKTVEWSINHFTMRDSVAMVVKAKCQKCGQRVHSENNFS
jgi:transcription elongation factor Elf1